MLTQDDLKQIKLIVKETERYLDQKFTWQINDVRDELVERIDQVITMIDEDLRPISNDIAKLKKAVFK